MIEIVKRQGLFLLFDATQNSTYRIASPSRTLAQRTLGRAKFASKGDWLDETQLRSALTMLRARTAQTGLEL